jgi:hypothetical protein
MSRPTRPARVGAGLVGLLLATGVAVPLTATPALADSSPARALVKGSCGGEQPYVEGARTASHGMPHHSQPLSAAADAYAQTAKVFVNADWDGASVDGRTGVYCTGHAEFDNVLHVGAGTSGKSVGDPVTLLATVDVDAGMDELNNDHQKQITSWSVVGGYTISDPASSGGPLGQVISSASRSVDTMLPNWWDQNGSWTWTASRGLAVRDSAGQDQRENWSDDGDVCEGFPCTIVLDPDVPFVLDRFDLPADPVTLVVHTQVGAALNVSGAVSLTASAYDGDVSAYVDALDGLDADIAPAAGFEGLQLTLGDDVPPPPPPADTVPPVATATPSAPANAAGWHKEAVTVQLAATDAGSGVASLDYTVNGVAKPTVTGGSAPVVVDQDGRTTITFTATDGAGNTSAPQTTVVDLDRGVPGWVLPSSVTVPATGPGGAAVSYTSTATDTLSGASGSCSPLSGSTFPVGTTTVSCTAVDGAGNSATASFPVTVTAAPAPQTPAQRIDALQASVAALSAPTAVKATLDAKLGQAETFVAQGKKAQACTHLAQFADHVAKSTGAKGLTATDATRLTADARAVRSALGC